MVSRTTLADALIETGMEPEAAERAARMFEEWQSASAGQAEMDKRFDRVDGQLNHLDERLTGQDRVFDARLQTNERELQVVGQQVEALKDSTEREFKAVNQRVEDLKDSTEREFKGFSLRFSDLRSEMNGRISDLRSEMNGRFTDLKDGMEQRFKDLKESLEQSLAQQKESLEAKIESEAALLRSEIEAVRHDQRVMRWVVGIGFTMMLGGFGAVIALLVHIMSRLP